MAEDLIDRLLTTDPKGDPNWQPLWGKDGSMSYGETIPTPQAAIRAFFRVARTLKVLVDSAPKTKDGIQFGSTRAIRAELAKLAILGMISKQSFYTVEKLSAPTKSVTTCVHAPHFAHEGAIQIISQMAMLPLGTDLQSDSTLTNEQVDLFNRRFNALEDLVDRLKPDTVDSGVHRPLAGTQTEPSNPIDLESDSGLTTEIQKEGSNPVFKPDGWVKADLVSQASEALGGFSSSTFDNIRKASGVSSSKRGGVGQQRRFSRTELGQLIEAVKAGPFRNKTKIAQSWQELLDL
jgi:hypothetical protein